MESTFINGRFQLPDLDAYVHVSIRIMGMLMSGALSQSNASLRKRLRRVRLDEIPLQQTKKVPKN